MGKNSEWSTRVKLSTMGKNEYGRRPTVPETLIPANANLSASTCRRTYTQIMGGQDTISWQPNKVFEYYLSEAFDEFFAVFFGIAIHKVCQGSEIACRYARRIDRMVLKLA